MHVATNGLLQGLAAHADAEHVATSYVASTAPCSVATKSVHDPDLWS